jgi:serine/threonine protein kinase
MHKFILDKKKFPQTSTNSRQNSGEKQITRILSLKHSKLNNPNSAGGNIKPTIKPKKPIDSNINSNLANKIKNIDKIGNNNNHNYMIPNVNINIDKNMVKPNNNNIVVNNQEDINHNIVKNYNNSLEEIQKALNIDNNKNLIYNNFIVNNNNINININNNSNNNKSKSNKIASTTKTKINTENFNSNEMDNKQKKILAKKNIIINKNYLSNLPPSSRQVILKNKIIKNNPNNTKGINNMNKKIKYNHKNKFTSSNINDNLKEKLIKKENNSLEELKNKNTEFNKGLLISRKIMTATNSPSHSIQINNFNKNNINVGGKTNLNKYQKDSKKNFKNPTNNISNKVSNNINNNENAQNLLMDSNKNDISGITYDNILSKDIVNSNDNLDTGTSHKKSSEKNTISDSRKSTIGKLKAVNDKIINKNKIHNFINNMNNDHSKNNVPFNPHNTLRSENDTTNKENSATEGKNNKISKNNNNNNKIVNDIKVIGGDIILDSANNMRPKENNGYYDDINCNFNVNNYLNENSLRDKKENTGKSQKQKEKIKLDKLKEKIISGKLINKKPNDKFIGINNNIKNKKIDKLLDKKNLEQLLLNKEKLIEYNKKIVSKKLGQINKAQQGNLNNKIPKINVKPAKKSAHNRNVDPNNFILNNRTNTSVLSTMKDCNYFNHECEVLSKYIKDYYKQNLCYPNTDLSFYKYGRVIGRGAFGKVNIGLNILTGRIVAIKSFNKKNIINEASKNKILYETNLMRGLCHPSVTKILETFECEKYMLIIMEYISGGNLQNFVKKRRKLCEKTAKILFRQIIQGIRYIHSRGIVHRDIKLENILLDLNNIIKICDFGVGKLIKPNTILKDQCGTPVYMAPEILKGNGYKGFPVDVWSAGVALYIMLSGTLPFNKDKDHDLEYSILNNNIKEIKDISDEGNNLLKNILEKDPNKRYTCNQILEHPWLNSNLIDDENPDLDYNNNIKNVNKYHLFTNAESILLAKTHIDYRNAQKKDLAENFTIKNLYTLDELNKKDVDTKSAILAPYNSMLSEEENGNISSSRRKESLCDILDNFNDELEIKNGIIKFHGKAKEFNMNYELNNNEEIDNGMLINSKNDLISLEDNEIKDSEKNIYLVKNNDVSDKNKNTNLQNKKHRPSSPYRPPPINKDFVKMVSDLGYDEDYVIKCLEKKELNHATTIYYLFSNYENVK